MSEPPRLCSSCSSAAVSTTSSGRSRSASTRSLVFGVAQLLLADHDGPVDRRDWLALAAGLIGLMCSGIAVTMTIVVGSGGARPPRLAARRVADRAAGRGLPAVVRPDRPPGLRATSAPHPPSPLRVRAAQRDLPGPRPASRVRPGAGDRPRRRAGPAGPAHTDGRVAEASGGPGCAPGRQLRVRHAHRLRPSGRSGTFRAHRTAVARPLRVRPGRADPARVGAGGVDDRRRSRPGGACSSPCCSWCRYRAMSGRSPGRSTDLAERTRRSSRTWSPSRRCRSPVSSLARCRYRPTTSRGSRSAGCWRPRTPGGLPQSGADLLGEGERPDPGAGPGGPGPTVVDPWLRGHPEAGRVPLRQGDRDRVPRPATWWR